ncbi:MAG: PSD1 and planctomycete cytochrome C domain-containing protein [Pirellulaceae bacterium]
MLPVSRLLILSCCAAWLVAGGESRIALGQSSPKGAAASDAAALPPAAERNVDFGEIEAILRKNCFSCHGAEHQESGLRLDVKKRALEGGDNGAVIKPGKSADSRLVLLVAGLDKETGPMPPEGKGKQLSAAEIGLIRAWIEQGANWPEGGVESAARHWSFQKVASAPTPAVKDAAWPNSPIDSFVLARLEKEGVSPSPPADKVTLQRRAYLDLIGLLPSPEEGREFVADSRPDSYERLIDRLLASPHYGERSGRHWLDQARYADSDGYEKDGKRPFAWRYRDWVIAALNADQPFDQFTVEQIAGDLLPGATQEQKIASGFHRNTLHNTEGGADQEEDRVKKTVDRTNTVSTVWLGLTLGCAQCHTHKYDPITQREYYQMYAFFNSINEENIEAPTPEAAAVLAVEREKHAKKLEELRAALKACEQGDFIKKQAEWEANAAKNPVVWQTLEISAATSKLGANLDVQSDKSVLVSGKNELSDVYTLEAVLKGNERITAVRLEVLPSDKLPAKGPGRANNGNFVLSTFGVEAKPAADGAVAGTKVTFAKAIADFSQGQCDVQQAINDNPADFWAVVPHVGQRHVAVFEAKEPIGHEGGTKLTITLDQAYNQTEPHNLGHFRLSVTTAPAPVPLEGLPPEVAGALAVDSGQRNDAQKKQIGDYFKTVETEYLKLAKVVVDHEAKAPKFPDDLKAQSVVELGKPRVTNIHLRGDFLAKGDPVEAKTIAALPVLASGGREPPDISAGVKEKNQGADAPRSPTRLELARWLVSPTNPLPARVTVNRLWQQHFGRGLVATSDDFGKQGEKPSHPELLDWQASDFVARGWSLKAVHRRTMLTSTYRQSARMRRDLAERDPENILLARQPRRRVESEVIRDLALSASGLFASRIGGPSVRPPQPTEYATITYAGSANWPESKGGDRYRRGLYTFFQRTSPYPMLMTFDTPDSNECAVRRMTSNTPLQALTLWNDPVFVEAAQVIGSRVVREVPGTASDELTRQRVRRAFELCLARSPDSQEEAALVTLYQQQLVLCGKDTKVTAALMGGQTPPAETSAAELAAWISVGRAIVNLDEFITRE